MEKSKIIEKLFLPILIYSFLLPPLLFLFSRRIKREIIVLLIYCILIFLLIFFFDITVAIRDYYQFIYTLIEYIAFTFILWNNIKNKKFKKLIIFSSILFTGFQVFYLISGEKKLLDSVPIGVETILILIYIFFFLYEQLRIQSIIPVYKNYVFWIAFGILIYLSGTFFFYILVNHLPGRQIQPYWFITYIFDILKNILFGVAVLVFANTPKEKISGIKNVPNLDFN